MERITAPYGFVPLSRTVVFPDWVQPREGRDGVLQAPPLHDVPFRDGISGTLVLEIVAETPIFSRGATDKTLPFQLPNGRYALPGTAVRGALRNVLEIATFSRFQRVNRNHRYAVRDLTPGGEHVYRRHMAAINAGWLRQHGVDRDSRGWTLEACDFGKLEYGHLQGLAEHRGIRGFRPNDKQTSVDKYRNWGGRALEVQLRLEERARSVTGWSCPSVYGVAMPGGCTRPGTLVFTGQPQKSNPGDRHKKHHDFVFFAAARPRTYEVSRQVFADFEFAHSNRGEQNNLGRSPEPNKEWGHWKPVLEKGGRIPVFFLTDPAGQMVTAFGLAMMFRLPYRHNIGEAVDHANPAHGDPEAGFDFAEGLFGTVRSGREGAGGRRHGGLALKGRVRISHAVAPVEAQPGPAVTAILGAPKASYYPNYVEQDPKAPGSHPPLGGPYKTWNDAGCLPRGWKRYRPLTATQKVEVATGGDVATTFRPLPADTRFRAHVDLHNVRPVEFGALLWTLGFGGDLAARHTLGLARPLGYGRVRFQVTDAALVRNDGETVDQAACVQEFEAWMGERERVPGWRQTQQIRELLALARPVQPQDAQYQYLKHPVSGINEFVQAKKDFLALPSAAGFGRRPGGGGAPGPGGPGRPPGPTQPPRPSPSGRFSGRPAPRLASSAPIRKPGESLLVKLKGLSVKNKWQCEAVEDPDSFGTIQGDAPEGVAVGQEHTVKVLQAANRKGMVLSWS